MLLYWCLIGSGIHSIHFVRLECNCGVILLFLLFFLCVCAQTNGSGLTASDLNVRATVHYGIPSTASILAVDSVQRLLAIGTL